MIRKNKPQVVIIGGGFAGLNAAKALKKIDVEVVLLDRTNHHLFQPLLYQVATAVLSPSEIAQPLRSILAHQKNAQVRLANVQRIDTENQRVILDCANHTINYDYLIVAAGAENFYYGNDKWKHCAPALKSIPDALAMRNHILRSYEEAEWAESEEERRRLLTFVVVGGGPTGVELAGALSEIASHSMTKNFRHIDPKSAHIILIEGGPRILGPISPKLAQDGANELKKMGVEIIVGRQVLDISNHGVKLQDRYIASATILWAAGVKPSPLVETLGVNLDKQGRAMVEPDLSIAGHKNVMVIGDIANFSHGGGAALPGVAQVAIQMGRRAAKNIANDLNGKPRKIFRYKNLGTMAQVGRMYALAEVGNMQLAGFAAWILWLVVHLRGICGFGLKIIVFIKWAWSFMTYKRSSRLVTEQRIDLPLEDKNPTQ